MKRIISALTLIAVAMMMAVFAPRAYAGTTMEFQEGFKPTRKQARILGSAARSLYYGGTPKEEGLVWEEVWVWPYPKEFTYSPLLIADMRPGTEYVRIERLSPLSRHDRKKIALVRVAQTAGMILLAGKVWGEFPHGPKPYTLAKLATVDMVAGEAIVVWIKERAGDVHYVVSGHTK